MPLRMNFRKIQIVGWKRDLGMGLITEHLQNRKNNVNLPKELRESIQFHLRNPPTESQEE